MKNENLIELKKIADLICEVRNKTDELLSDLRDDDSFYSDSDLEHDVLFVLENAESAIDSIIDEVNKEQLANKARAEFANAFCDHMNTSDFK